MKFTLIAKRTLLREHIPSGSNLIYIKLGPSNRPHLAPDHSRPQGPCCLHFSILSIFVALKNYDRQIKACVFGRGIFQQRLESESSYSQERPSKTY